ncbi:MAG: hypothetical protein WCR21_10775 [Bacteroidota bacterium]
MAVDELIDETAFDPKKLFNDEEYSSLIIKRDGFSKQENSDDDLVEALLENKNTRQEDEALFASLKELKAQDLLVNTIQSTNVVDFKIKLLAACWETGLEFATHFLFFVNYACDTNFQMAMEALTVIENEEGTISMEVLQAALELAKNNQGGHAVLKQDLIKHIQSRINS